MHMHEPISLVLQLRLDPIYIFQLGAKLAQQDSSDAPGDEFLELTPDYDSLPPLLNDSCLIRSSFICSNLDCAEAGEVS